MRVRDHRQREFGLGAERVEARRVEHDQAAFQERVRITDHGVAPGGDFHLVAVFFHHGRNHRIVVVPQSERARLVDADHFDFDQVFHRLGHVFARIDIQPHLDPLDLLAFERADGFLPLARLDRQEAHVRFFCRVVKDLGRAHGGAADVRRQQALLEVGEEHGVDEFGLAARKLGEKCQRHAVVAQALDQIVDAQRLLDVGIAVGIEPGLVGLDP